MIRGSKNDHELYRMYIIVQHVSDHPSIYSCLEIAVMVCVSLFDARKMRTPSSAICHPGKLRQR